MAFGGLPLEAVKKAFNEAEIYVSPYLLKEYRETPSDLVAKRKINYSQFKALISGTASLLSRAKVVEIVKEVTFCRDVEDNMIIECVLAAEADFLITGDYDLLDIRDMPYNFAIVSPRKFIKIDL